MKGRKFSNRLACPPPAAEAIPTPFAPGSISPPQYVISAAAPAPAPSMTIAEAKKQKEQLEVPVAPSPSPYPSVIPEPKLGSPRLFAPETLSSEVDPAVRGRKREENQKASVPLLEPVEEAWGDEEKKQKRCKHKEKLASRWQSAVSSASIFVEDKTANVVAPQVPEQGKRKWMRVKEQKQWSQSPLLFDVHRQGGREAAEGPKCENVAVRSSTRMPSNREIIKMRIQARKQQPLPEGFWDAVAKDANPSTNSIEKNSNYSSPFGALFDQFCYKRGDCRLNHNSPSFPESPDQPARSPPGGRLSFEPSQLASNGTSKAANTQILNASVSSSQEVMCKENQAAGAPMMELVEEAGGNEEKKRKRCKHGEEPGSLSQSGVSGAPIFVVQEKTANVVLPAAEQGKRKQSWVKEQEHSSQSPLLFDVHRQGGKEAAEGPKCENIAVRCSTRMPSKREIIRMRIEARKQQPLPEGLWDAVAKAGNHSTNSIEKKSNCSSPFGGLFDQFCYKRGDCRLNHNSPSFPESPDQPARSPPGGHLSFEPSQLASNGTSKAANTQILNASVSSSQEVMCKENQAAAALMMELVEEAGGNEEKKRKRYKHGEEPGSLSQSAVSGAPIFVVQENTVNVVVPTPEQGKRKQSWVKEQEHLSQSPLLFDVHRQGGKEAAEGPKCENVAVRCSIRMPSKHEIIRMRIEARKQQSLPEGLWDAVAKAGNDSTNSIEKKSNCSSPFGGLFDQSFYEPDRWLNHNSPTFRKPLGCPARSPLGGRLTFESSQVTANGTSKAANTQILNAPVSLSQEVMQAKDNEKPEKRMSYKKKQRQPKPLLRTVEKWSDKYRWMPLDQVVPPPRSPHKLLQEKYASDPWKVIVICMLLNLTQGKQVRKKVKGFFKRYPDPQTACRADPAKMAKYLKPLGLHNVKTDRIQRFSKDYVEKEWTYITELCGVGKYAADAYAIFCAGRATEVVPEDHKLVDYWNYVCFELPLIQGSENAQEPGVTDQLEKVVPKVLESDVCC